MRAIFTVYYKTITNLSQVAREAQNSVKDSFTKKYNTLKWKITMKGKVFLRSPNILNVNIKITEKYFKIWDYTDKLIKFILNCFHETIFYCYRTKLKDKLKTRESGLWMPFYNF